MTAALARPPLDEVRLNQAREEARMSTCDRLHVGAVLTTARGQLISSGRNGAPAGLGHCDHTCTCGGQRVAATCEPECFSLRPCDVAVHAEANVIVFAGLEGRATRGSTMYVTHSPCRTCAGLIVNAGIVRVVYGELYRSRCGLGVLEAADVEVCQYLTRRHGWC